MIIRQLIDYDSNTYTYLLADKNSRKATLIDPVLGQVKLYLQLLKELNLQLTFTLDTHVHADHVTALSALRTHTKAKTYVGNPGEVNGTDHPLHDGQVLKLGALSINIIFTPGHTDNSFCFYLNDNNQGIIFTGDTLLIRGTGRTDFQNGNAASLYDSLHTKILSLPDNTKVYPGHDYNGLTQSTIQEEKQYNPRLQIMNKNKFIDYMSSLNLDKPKYMDIAVAANLNCGKT